MINKRVILIRIASLVFILFSLLLILHFTIIFKSNPHLDYQFNLNDNDLKNAKPFGKIYIKNDNWSGLGSDVSGDGSYSNPWVIKDLVIDCEGSGIGILISSSNDYFRIENCTISNSGIDPMMPLNVYAGIKLCSTANGTLFDNHFLNNDDCGIILSSSENNTIKENTVEFNYNGIFIESSKDNNITGNTINNNDNYGMEFRWLSSKNNIITGNIINDNWNGGIKIHSYNNTFSNNAFQGCGVVLAGTLGMMNSHTIETTNLVNGDPIKYFVNMSDLKPIDFQGAGEIHLVNCSNSSISNINIEDTTYAISLYYSYNITIKDNSLSYNKLGFFLGYSHNNTISNSDLIYNDFGIESNGCDNNTFKENTISHCWGFFSAVKFSSCNFNNFSDNKILSSSYNGLDLTSCHNNTIFRNTIRDNGGYILGDGARITSCNNNTIMANLIENSAEYGIRFLSSDNNTIFGNILNYNKISAYTIDVGSENNEFNWNVINRTISPFIINDNGIGNLTWDKTAYQLAWCNGSGKWNDPYVIYDLIVNGFNTKFCINIVNSTSYFKIENCKVYNANTGTEENNEVGIKVTNSTNVILFNNNCTNNYGYGIYLEDGCKNITISENFIQDNKYCGIGLSNCINNTLLNNQLSYNYNGVKLSHSYNNTLLENQLSYHYNGIIISQSNNNTLLRNNIVGRNDSPSNTAEIYLENSKNNTILDNKLEKNGYTGIFLDSCEDNNISKNLINGKEFCGILLKNSSRSMITNNSMGGCGIHFVEYDSIEKLITNQIDISNLVNNKSIYYYTNRISLNPNDFYEAGQVILVNCSYSTISNLNIDNGTCGISLFECKNNIILENHFSIHSWSGIYLLNSSNNDILRNIISNNDELGIYLDGINSTNNNIYYNNFDENIINAQDNGTNNFWDDGFAGNYWEDYIGNDLNPRDGIGDTIYLVSGSANSNDSKPLLYPTFQDEDGDGLFNYEEYTLGNDGYRTNVLSADSDNDGLTDYLESLYSTNPWDSDTDNDGMPDNWEIEYNLKPLENDAMNDTDGDQLANLFEYLNGTDPNNNDTDGDMILDSIEISLNTNPLNPHWYPMPNLKVISFIVNDIDEGEPLVFDLIISNDGIWKAETVLITIRCEELNLTLYENIASPFELDVDQSLHIISNCSGINTPGFYTLSLIIDPFDIINETYSSKDGSINSNWQNDNIEVVQLQIKPAKIDTNDDFDISLLIIILSIVIISSLLTTLLLVLRPKLKKRSFLKKEFEKAKEVVKSFEQRSRNFVKEKLIDYYEDDWWDNGIPNYLHIIVNSKIKNIQTKRVKFDHEKMEFIDLHHFPSIILFKDNWKKIFSECFPNKSLVIENFENIRILKENIYQNQVSMEELSKYQNYIFAIQNYFPNVYNIFLSYSTLDSKNYEIPKIAENLEKYPEIDRVLFWEVDSKENIVEYMEETLKISNTFILFCSENSAKSQAVEDEWQAAYQLMKKGKIKLILVYENENFIPVLLLHLKKVLYNKEKFNDFIEKLYNEAIK